MELATWGSVSGRQPALPRLRVAQERKKESVSPRRCSLSSSRTGDSGYISDPDTCIALSPLEFGGVDPLPYSSSDFALDSSALLEVKEVAGNRRGSTGYASNLTFFKKHKNLQKALLTPKVEITFPPTSCPAERSKPDWTNAFRNTFPSSSSQAIAPSRHEDVEQWITENLRPQEQCEERKLSITSISSTGSCDMYSTSDNSDDEETLDAVSSPLSKAALTTIELIMRNIELNLGYAAYVQCAGSQGSRAQGNTSSKGGGSGRGSSQSGGGGKRKSRLDDHLTPDDPDEDGANKRRRVSTTTTEDSEPGPRFACPFYKHDPNRYRNRRTCHRPGWPTVHRMKEHLYRSHAQPIFCPRCYMMFDSDQESFSHLRATPCQISAPQPIEGIDRETLKTLRKRSPALRLEEDKWRDTYQLLFPDVSAADIPSPYYDSDSPTEESRRFRRELLERVRRELFATAEREPGPVEQRLLCQVAGIIQRCENDLLTSFYADHDSARLHPSMPGSRRTSAVPLQDYPTPARPFFEAPSFGSGSNAPLSTQLMDPPISPRTSDAIFQPQPQQQRMDEVADVPGRQGQLPNLGCVYSPYDLVDWNAIYPPGTLDMQVLERGAALATPAWT